MVVLEGARAVGKTMLVQKELPDNYHYESLADSSTFAYASEHLDQWLAELPTPCIIDEAQLIPQLPLQIKRIIDDSTEQGPLFILTGSASITRNGLGGQDPLARRSQRYTLYPLTRREINGNASTSIVDALWRDTPNKAYESHTSRDALVRYMTLGGFPSYALGTPMMGTDSLMKLVRADINDVLGDTVLPDERLDAVIAGAVLKELLAEPGGILNRQRIASTLALDPRTVERYLSIFMNRFLITTLPNSRQAPSKQTFARAKIHPLDTSFSVEALRRAGKDIAVDKVLFGKVFESFVVTQIVPEIQWSQTQPDASYWREAGKHPKEVDLVLQKDGALIAVEMKSNDSVSREDFAGIAALRDKDPGRFHRGFVIYTGKKVLPFSTNMWAIPISALWDSDGFESHALPNSMPIAETESKTATMTVQPTASDASIFLSYCHKDNEHLNGGIVKLIEDLAQEYEYSFGNGLTVFTDNDISWGERWRKALSEHINSANIIIPAITPAYVRSDACRKELLEFDGKSSNEDSNRILTLMLRDIAIDDADESDPVIRIIKEHQWKTTGDIRLMTDAEYQRMIITLAQDLHKVIADINAKIDRGITSVSADQSQATRSDDNNAAADFLEALAALQPKISQLKECSDGFVTESNAISEAINAYPAPGNADPAALLHWSYTLAAETQDHVDAINEQMDEISSTWNAVYQTLDQYVSMIERLPQGALRNEFLETCQFSIQNLGEQLRLPSDADQTLTAIQLVSNFSRQLRPMAEAFIRAINMLRSISTMVNTLNERLAALPR